MKLTIKREGHKVIWTLHSGGHEVARSRERGFTTAKGALTSAAKALGGLAISHGTVIVRPGSKPIRVDNRTGARLV